MRAMVDSMRMPWASHHHHCKLSIGATHKRSGYRRAHTVKPADGAKLTTIENCWSSHHEWLKRRLWIPHLRQSLDHHVCIDLSSKIIRPDESLKHAHANWPHSTTTHHPEHWTVRPGVCRQCDRCGQHHCRQLCSANARISHTTRASLSQTYRRQTQALWKR